MSLVFEWLFLSQTRKILSRISLKHFGMLVLSSSECSLPTWGDNMILLFAAIILYNMILLFAAIILHNMILLFAAIVLYNMVLLFAAIILYNMILLFAPLFFIT